MAKRTRCNAKHVHGSHPWVLGNGSPWDLKQNRRVAIDMWCPGVKATDEENSSERT